MEPSNTLTMRQVLNMEQDGYVPYSVNLKAWKDMDENQPPPTYEELPDGTVQFYDAEDGRPSRIMCDYEKDLLEHFWCECNPGEHPPDFVELEIWRQTLPLHGLDAWEKFVEQNQTQEQKGERWDSLVDWQKQMHDIYWHKERGCTCKSAMNFEVVPDTFEDILKSILDPDRHKRLRAMEKERKIAEKAALKAEKKAAKKAARLAKKAKKGKQRQGEKVAVDSEEEDEQSDLDADYDLDEELDTPDKQEHSHEEVAPVSESQHGEEFVGPARQSSPIEVEGALTIHANNASSKKRKAPLTLVDAPEASGAGVTAAKKVKRRIRDMSDITMEVADELVKKFIEEDPELVDRTFYESLRESKRIHETWNSAILEQKPKVKAEDGEDDFKPRYWAWKKWADFPPEKQAQRNPKAWGLEEYKKFSALEDEFYKEAAREAAERIAKYGYDPHDVVPKKVRARGRPRKSRDAIVSDTPQPAVKSVGTPYTPSKQLDLAALSLKTPPNPAKNGASVQKAYGVTPAQFDQAVKAYFHSLTPLFMALDQSKQPNPPQNPPQVSPVSRAGEPGG